jgi:transcriptional regulator with XRE-family HTH domain
MTDAALAVRTARRSRGFTQEQLAQRTGLDQARVSRAERARENPRFDTVKRLLAGTGHRFYAAPTTRDDAATIAAQVRESLSRRDSQGALRNLVQLNDNLVAEQGLVRGVLAVAEPELTGWRLWDAAIAALVAWRLNEVGVPLPNWVNSPTRKLDRARFLRVDAADPIPTADDIPAEFAERGVLVWHDTFASV